MSVYTLIWQRPAMTGFGRLLKADPQLAKSVRSAVAALVDAPEPMESAALGTPDLRRLRVGDARILYRVNEQQNSIDVLTVGRAGG